MARTRSCKAEVAPAERAWRAVAVEFRRLCLHGSQVPLGQDTLLHNLGTGEILPSARTNEQELELIRKETAPVPVSSAGSPPPAMMTLKGKIAGRSGSLQHDMLGHVFMSSSEARPHENNT